jgi:hypothetical protein
MKVKGFSAVVGDDGGRLPALAGARGRAAPGLPDSEVRQGSVTWALQNAASMATLLLTSDALVAEMPKEEKKAGGGTGYEDMY